MIIALLLSSLAFAQPAPETPLDKALLAAKTVRAGSQPNVFSGERWAFNNKPVLVRARANFGESRQWNNAYCVIDTDDMVIAKAAVIFVGKDGRSLQKTRWKSDMVTPNMPAYFSRADLILKRETQLEVNKTTISQYRAERRSCLKGREESGFNSDGEWYTWFVCDELGPINSYSLNTNFSLHSVAHPSLSLDVSCWMDTQNADRTITLNDFERALNGALTIEF